MHIFEINKIDNSHLLLEFQIKEKEILILSQNFKTNKWLSLENWSHVYKKVNQIVSNYIKTKVKKKIVEDLPGNLKIRMDFIPINSALKKVFKLTDYKYDYYLKTVVEYKIDKCSSSLNDLTRKVSREYSPSLTNVENDSHYTPEPTTTVVPIETTYKPASSSNKQVSLENEEYIPEREGKKKEDGTHQISYKPTKIEELCTKPLATRPYPVENKHKKFKKIKEASSESFDTKTENEKPKNTKSDSDAYSSRLRRPKLSTDLFSLPNDSRGPPANKDKENPVVKTSSGSNCNNKILMSDDSCSKFDPPNNITIREKRSNKRKLGDLCKTSIAKSKRANLFDSDESNSSDNYDIDSNVRKKKKDKRKKETKKEENILSAHNLSINLSESAPTKKLTCHQLSIREIENSFIRIKPILDKHIEDFFDDKKTGAPYFKDYLFVHDVFTEKQTESMYRYIQDQYLSSNDSGANYADLITRQLLPAWAINIYSDLHNIPTDKVISSINH